MIRCIGERDGVRCQRRMRYIHPKGVESGFIWSCEGCANGREPYVPRESARKGQQKQAKKK